MINEEKVSIVVPVYNVALYLVECIESIINQTYKNIEVILVNDGSTDNSKEICENYAKKDDRIIFITKQNNGAASARNYGLNIVTGKYIGFVDSDDILELNYIERLVTTLKNNNVDIAVCSYYNLYKNTIKEQVYEYQLVSFSDEEYLERFLKDWTCGLIWNKLFKADVIKNNRFEEGHKIDDEFFTYRCVMNSKKVVLFNEPLYYYRWRLSSVMQEYSDSQEQFIKDRLSYLTQRYDNVIEQYPSLKIKYLENLMDNLISLKKLCNTNTLKKIYKDVIKKYIFHIIFSKIAFKSKAIFFINIIFIDKNMKIDSRENEYECFK